MRRSSFSRVFRRIASAIIVSGNQDGMQIKLAIPESEMGNAIGLQLLRGKVLRVTVESDQDKIKAGPPAIKRTAAKQRV